MKRFHLHMHVNDLDHNVRFYSALFGAPPTRVESDYAKWMLQDPPVNFAISTRGTVVGIDHLGIQTDNPADLAHMQTQAMAADRNMLDMGTGTCCYSRSTKHWVTDPQGVAWERFHTLEGIPTFHEQKVASVSDKKQGFAIDSIDFVATKNEASCCPPNRQSKAGAC